MKKIFFWMLLSATVVLASCGKDEPEGGKGNDAIPVSGVSLDRVTLSLKEGSKVALVATVAPENATDKSVKWSSSDESVATVSETGEVTAIKEGVATLTVTSVADASLKAACEVTVIREIRIGDYYMKDGSVLDGNTSPLSDQQKTDCIGVVFWVGDPTNAVNGDPVLRSEHPGCIHGLVVALKDASDKKINWQGTRKNWVDIGKWQEANLTGYENIATDTNDTDNFQKILGYNNTKVIERYNAYCDSEETSDFKKLKIEPVIAISLFAGETPAPANSSGWYLPSPRELSILFSGWYDGNIWSIQSAGLESLVSNAELINLRIGAVRGGETESSIILNNAEERYWSSSQNIQYPGSAFNIKSTGEFHSDGKYLTHRVRPVLAF